MKYLPLLFTILIGLKINAQEQEKVLVKGTVVDAENQKLIPYAQIASFQQMKVFSADVAGDFNLMLSPDDSIRVVVMGFESANVTVKTIMNSAKPYEIRLRHAYIPLKEVVIQSETANDHLAKVMPKDIIMGYVNPIHPTLREDFGGRAPLLAAIIKPIDFAYNRLSRVEKNKRRAKKLLVTESIRNQYSKELVAEITGLKGKELDDFFVYCNTNIEMKRNEIAPMIRIKIINAWEKYRKGQLPK
jgi:CarboxypepD_reg-like domain